MAIEAVKFPQGNNPPFSRLSGSFMNWAINTYQWRRGRNHTAEKCVIAGVSCSERFRNNFHVALENGSSFSAAALFASQNTINDCMTINQLSAKKAALKLAIVTGLTFLIGGGADCTSAIHASCGCPDPHGDIIN